MTICNREQPQRVRWLLADHGVFNGTITAFIQQLERPEPLLVWAEPDPTGVDLQNSTGRRTDFCPISKGPPVWPDEIALVEARLFYDSQAIHVVSTAKGCRWVRFEEDKDVQQDTSFVYKYVKPLVALQLHSGCRFDNNLLAIEYHQNGRMVGWRMLIDE